MLSWVYVAAVAVGAVWILWWWKRPHQRRSGAIRSQDGYFGMRQAVTKGYARDLPRPRDHAAPEDPQG